MPVHQAITFSIIAPIIETNSFPLVDIKMAVMSFQFRPL